MRRREVLLAALVVTAMALVGCGGRGAATPEAADTDAVRYYKLPGGAVVMCVWQSSAYGGGLSCDWEGVGRRVRGAGQ